MILVIFGVGVLVFFLTVYGTVVAGGMKLTKQQLESSPELRSRSRPQSGALGRHPDA